MAKGKSDILVSIGAAVDTTVYDVFKILTGRIKLLTDKTRQLNTLTMKKSGFVESQKELAKTIEKNNNKIEEQKNKIKELESVKTDLDGKSAKDFLDPTKARQLQIDREALADSMLRAKDSSYTNFKERQLAIDKLNAEKDNLNKLILKYNEYKDKRKAAIDPKVKTGYKTQMDKVKDQIDAARKSIKAYQAEYDKTATKKGVRLGSTLDRRAKTLDNREIKLNADAEKKYQQAIQDTNSKLEQEQKRLDALEQKKEQYAKQDEEYTKRIIAAEQEMAMVTTQTRQKLFKLFATGVANVSKTAYKTAVTGIKGIIKYVGKLSGIYSEAASKAFSLSKIIRLVVQYGFGFRSLYYLVRRLRSSIKEGFGYLAKYSNEVKEPIDDLKKSIYFLKSAVAAAIQPLLNLFQITKENTTLLQYLINKASEAAVTVANFFATFTGQKQIYKATTDLNAYKNALDETADSAKNTLAAFDDINVLDSSTSTDSGELNTSGWFSMIDVEPSYFAKLLKDAWKNADFTSVGKYITNRVKNWLNKTITKELPNTMAKIGKMVGTFINGLNTDNIGAVLGEKVALILNSISSYIGSMTSSIKWDELGKSIAKSLENFIKTFDLKQFLQNIIDRANGIVTMLATAIGETPWDEVGIAIGEAFANLDTTQLKENFKTLVKNLWEGIKEAINAWKEDDPESFGIAAHIVNVLIGLKVAGTLIPYVVDIVDAIFLASTVKSAITTGISTSLAAGITGAAAKNGAVATAASGAGTVTGDLFAATFISKFLLVLAAADLGTQIAYILGLTSEEQNQKIADTYLGTYEEGARAYKQVLNDIYQDQNGAYYQKSMSWTGKYDFKLIGDDIAKQIIAGYTGGLSTSLTDLETNGLGFHQIVEADIMSAKEFAEIHSPSKVTEEIGKFLMEGFLLGLNSEKENLRKFFDELIDYLNNDFSINWQGAWTNIVMIFSKAWNGMLDMVQLVVNGIISAINSVSNKLNSISIRIPDWVPGFGGKSYGFNLPTFGAIDLSKYKIPELATGAVIPPNKQFLAMLGDQTSGTNVEAPLDTIVQAMQMALGNNNQTIVMNIDGKTFARLTVPRTLDELKRSGYNVKVLEG